MIILYSSQSFASIISFLALLRKKKLICVHVYVYVCAQYFAKTSELWLEWVRRNVETALPITFTCVTQNLISSLIIWKCRRNRTSIWITLSYPQWIIFQHTKKFIGKYYSTCILEWLIQRHRLIFYKNWK